METLLALANAAGSAAPPEQLGIFVQELRVMLQPSTGLTAGRQLASLLLSIELMPVLLQAALVVMSQSEVLLQAFGQSLHCMGS